MALLFCGLPVFFAASWLQTPRRADMRKVDFVSGRLYTKLGLPTVEQDVSLPVGLFARQPAEGLLRLATARMQGGANATQPKPANNRKATRIAKPLRRVVWGRKGRWSNDGERMTILTECVRSPSETWSHPTCLQCEPAKTTSYVVETPDLFAGQKPWKTQMLTRKHLRALFEAFTMPRALSNELYKQVEVIHRVFEAHGLPYVADGGTSLGAVRHGGLIPWDDDVDVLIAKEKIGLLMGPVRDALRQEGYDVRCAGPHLEGTILYQIHPQGPSAPQGYTDIFIGDYKSGGLWGYRWGVCPLLIKKEEFDNTRVVPFGPVKIRVLANAESVLKSTFGGTCLTEIRATHVHHKRTTPLARDTKLPVYFPDDEPAFYHRPAGWDADLFPQAGAAQRRRS